MGGIKTILHEVGQILIPAFSAYCLVSYSATVCDAYSRTAADYQPNYAS